MSRHFWNSFTGMHFYHILEKGMGVSSFGKIGPENKEDPSLEGAKCSCKKFVFYMLSDLIQYLNIILYDCVV